MGVEPEEARKRGGGLGGPTAFSSGRRAPGRGLHRDLGGKGQHTKRGADRQAAALGEVWGRSAGWGARPTSRDPSRGVRRGRSSGPERQHDWGEAAGAGGRAAGGIPRTEGGATQKRKPKGREVPRARLEKGDKEPGVQLPAGGSFGVEPPCGGGGRLCGTGAAGRGGWGGTPATPGKAGGSRSRSRLPPGDPRGGDAGGRGRAADTAASAAAAAPGCHWPPALP